MADFKKGKVSLCVRQGTERVEVDGLLLKHVAVHKALLGLGPTRQSDHTWGVTERTTGMLAGVGFFTMKSDALYWAEKADALFEQNGVPTDPYTCEWLRAAVNEWDADQQRRADLLREAAVAGTVMTWEQTR